MSELGDVEEDCVNGSTGNAEYWFVWNGGVGSNWSKTAVSFCVESEVGKFWF